MEGGRGVSSGNLAIRIPTRFSCLRGGAGNADETNVFERHAGNRCLSPQFCFGAGLAQVGLAQTACRPPCSQRVVEQEAHHVGLGEELRNRRQLVRTDLGSRSVHLVLLPGLPELIDPP